MLKFLNKHWDIMKTNMSRLFNAWIKSRCYEHMDKPIPFSRNTKLKSGSMGPKTKEKLMVYIVKIETLPI